MPVDYEEVWAELEEEEARLTTELKIIQSAKPGIKALRERQVSFRAKSQRFRFAGMGATKAIPLLLDGKTIPMTSREIHDALKAEGWTSNSSDTVATVSATLSQLRGESVERIGEGWRLKVPNSVAPEENDPTEDQIPF